MPDAVPVAVDGLIRSRALVLDEIAARQSAGRAPSERTDPARIALRSAQQRLANLMARGPGQMSPVQYTAVVEDARRESELAEQATGGTERRVQGRAQPRATRPRRGDGLAPCRRCARLDSFATTERVFAGPARSISSTVAFVRRFRAASESAAGGRAARFGAERSTSWCRSGERTSPPRRWPRRQFSVTGRSDSSRQSGAALRRLDLGSRRLRHLGNASRVFIVTDGLLNLVPFRGAPRRTAIVSARKPPRPALPVRRAGSRALIAHPDTRARPPGDRRCIVRRCEHSSEAGQRNRLAA